MNFINQDIQKIIEACSDCAVSCSNCASSCLQEENVADMVTCIQLDLECAALCRSTAELLSLGSGFSAHLCRICADACVACATECEKHAEMGMEHCRRCAQACRNCAQACEEIATAE
ncbi:four-helix bundle copper-binding protein [Dyadobacter tibetensis]|uniref:four-helix bundle copper-binding protein n=1 Tax=Dyadobacter tibetensis TaxID=1211851 RepID=UPI0004B3B76C|nr:four-helix bundle copper-binding protein [Dyadobacter tibetensis]